MMCRMRMRSVSNWVGNWIMMSLLVFCGILFLVSEARTSGQQVPVVGVNGW